MDSNQLKDRFKLFALSVIRFAEGVPNDLAYKNIKGQMIRSGSSSAANYRSALRGRSRKDFISRLTIVEEELDETMFWLEMLVGISDSWRTPVAPIWKEANELISIIVATINSTRNRNE